MKVLLPTKVVEFLSAFQKIGKEIYLVGGAVRDLLLGKAVDDWDFTTPLSPEEILRTFPDNSFYDNVFGTVGVKIGADPHLEIFEVTTFRTESDYSDNRRPSKINWGSTLSEDLARRDFTINAMAMRITGDTLISWNENDENVWIEVDLIDEYGGQEDLKNKVVRCVREPDERFKEDALRMMRAIRISTEQGFMIEKKTYESIKENYLLLKNIAQERITAELKKIFASQYPVEGVKFLQTSGILSLIFPELIAGYGMVQKGHHVFDVYEHSLKSLQYCDNPDWVVRLAALLHDVGKPIVVRGEGENRTFYNHETVGAKVVRKIAFRLKLSRKETEKLVTLVRWHMFSVSEFLTDAAIRRFIRRVGEDNINDMLDVRIADRLGSGCTQAESWRLRDFKERIIEVQKHIPSVRDLKVNGVDVMQILEIKPGPLIGKILNSLFEEILDDPAKNERNYLLSRIKELNFSLNKK